MKLLELKEYIDGVSFCQAVQGSRFLLTKRSSESDIKNLSSTKMGSIVLGASCLSFRPRGEASCRSCGMPPKSDTYAVQDIGMVVDHLRELYHFTNDPEETLAVLHNKNRLVHAFCRSGWIQDTDGMVLARSVASCAGMTAKVTIIAQTRIGLLSGLRRFAGGEEAEDAYDVQREEAAARATVALTRAKELCVILGPLDMLGLIGAATVIGSLMYGVGLCWQQGLEFHYQHKELGGEMDDEQMVQQLKDAGACSELPPLALAEVVHLIDDDFQVRRLHLIMVGYTSCWPFRLPQTIVSVRPPSKTTFVRLRKRVQAKHILGGLEINWGLIKKHLWMDGPPMLSRADLENQLFLLRSGSTTSATYKGRDRARWGPWTQRRDTLWWGRTYTPPRLAFSMSAWIIWGNTNHQSYLDWLAQVEREQIQTGRFKTKKGYWIVKRSRQT